MEKRRKKNRKHPIITVLLIIIAAAVVLAGYLWYNYYIRISHPLKYTSYVERYSRDFNVDKYLVYAVIKTESGYDPQAVSNVGARGLMQIMEDSFDWIKFKLDDDEAVYMDMFDPETNIRYGTYLLGFLYEEFGNVEATMAAYHAGRGKVNEWLLDPEISSDGKHLDTIPIPDTAHYVSKIKRAMSVYVDLYNKK